MNPMFRPQSLLRGLSLVLVLALLFGIDLRSASAAPPQSSARTITVKALIDGRSWLVLHGNTAQWYQIDYAAPGRWAAHNDPTLINGKTWFPTWPDVPDDDNYSCNCYSSVFNGVTPPLPASKLAVNITNVDVRGAVYIMQMPSADNDYTLIVEFNDDYLDGAAMYEVQIDVTALKTRTFTVSAMIDGRSQLWMRGNTAQWYHMDFAAPGRLEGANDPTIINGAEWYPAWPDVPDAENRDCFCMSSIFRGVKPSVPGDNTYVTLNVIQGRGQVYLTSVPSDVSQHYLTIDFDDDPEPGAALYVVEVIVDYVR